MMMEMMPMSFGKFSDYRLKLLFVTWDITEKWQFGLSWLAVCLAVIVYHALRFYISVCEVELIALKQGKLSDTTLLMSKGSPQRLQLKVIHALLSSLNYGLALMLMLVAMTYNPSLFVALMVGYFLGDFLFHHERDAAGDGSSTNCH